MLGSGRFGNDTAVNQSLTVLGGDSFLWRRGVALRLALAAATPQSVHGTAHLRAPAVELGLSL